MTSLVIFVRKKIEPELFKKFKTERKNLERNFYKIIEIQ